MTPQEFKAWFDGYTEAISDLPTKKQWARVKERVAEIDGKPMTERVFVDRYWPYTYPHHQYLPWAAYCGNLSGGTYQNNLSANAANAGSGSRVQQFSNLSAMNALGRAEAAA